MRDTVLVTGGAGYIGSHTVRQLVGAGYRVVVLDDLSTGHRGAVYGNPEKLPVAETAATRPINRYGRSKRITEGMLKDVAASGNTRGFGVREVLRMIKEVSRAKLRIEDGARRAGDAAVLVAESSRIRKVLGWGPQHDDLQVICSSAYRWEIKLRRTSPGDRAHAPA